MMVTLALRRRLESCGSALVMILGREYALWRECEPRDLEKKIIWLVYKVSD